MAGAHKSKMPKQPTGSPLYGEPAFLVVGKLRHTHGVHGEILMQVITDFPERLKVGLTVYVGEQRQPERIRSQRNHGQGLLLAFDGYTSPEAVGELRNALVYVPAADRPRLPEGEYYHHQLLGLHVIGEDGSELGRVDEILSTAAHDIYVVRAEGGPEILLPAIDDVILEIDLANGRMRVHLLPGLI